VVDALNRHLRRISIWAVYLIGALPAPILLYMGATGGLGFEPIKELEQELGLLALQFLILGLAITPARRYLGLNLIRFRRSIGLLSFFYVVVHLLTWLMLDIGDLGGIWAGIVKRPFITIGMLACVVMLPLALTSNNWSVRRLGPRWRSLHKAVYAIALLGGAHFILLAKGFQVEPLLYMALICGLLALRLPKRRQLSST